jgi:hypothetical protein
LPNNPQMQRLREEIARNPAAFQALIQQLTNQYPTMAQTLAQDPEGLLRALAPALDDEGQTDLPPGTRVISITEDERDAIARVYSI